MQLFLDRRIFALTVPVICFMKKIARTTPTCDREAGTISHQVRRFGLYDAVAD